jgi:hypothetical protein
MYPIEHYLEEKFERGVLIIASISIDFGDYRFDFNRFA